MKTGRPDRPPRPPVPRRRPVELGGTGDGPASLDAPALDAPLVAIAGAEGACTAVQDLLSRVPPQSGIAFVAQLPPNARDAARAAAQRSLRIVEVDRPLSIAPGALHLLPDDATEVTRDGRLVPGGPRDADADAMLRGVAQAWGAQAAAVVLSGEGELGAAGLREIKACGGVTLAQAPDEAVQARMPRVAIATGLVDWVLPAAEMPLRLLDHFGLADLVPASIADPGDDALLRELLELLRRRLGRDFADLRRATLLARIARRMHVTGCGHLTDYLQCLRTHSAEWALLQDSLLVGTTGFFRDPEAFAALERELPRLFRGRGAGDAVRVWVPACATGEEAYSIAMLLAEHARELASPPSLQVFATDVSAPALRAAREALYPGRIERELAPSRLEAFFMREPRGWRVRRDLRDCVLFAHHDALQDSPFSRIDLVACRNLLADLNPDAQQSLLEALHFSLRPQGMLFLGAAESAEDAHRLYETVDAAHRLYARREPAQPVLAPAPADLTAWPLRGSPSRGSVQAPATRPPGGGEDPGMLHLRLLEGLAPPSILVDARDEVVHLSATAGRFLLHGAGKPSRSLVETVHPQLRPALSAGLHEAAHRGQPVELTDIALELGGTAQRLDLRVAPVEDAGRAFFLVSFRVQDEAGAPAPDAPVRALDAPLARHLERELERMKHHLRETVEQYEASTEELQASNEELQAMNEELRLAAEELQATREEQQSVNEELSAVNDELTSRIAELGHANGDLQNLMAATDIATVFLDRDLRILRFTPAAVGVFKFIADDVGRPLADLANPLAYPELMADARQVLERLALVEREVAHCDGRWFLARVLPYRLFDDRIAGVVLSLIDVTERKRSQIELVRALEDNQQARRALEAADAAKDRFLAVLSHELRNPLASVTSAAEVIADPQANAKERRRGVEVVRRQAAAMQALLDDLLDVTRLRFGRLHLRIAPTSLRRVVAMAQETAAMAIAGRGQTLSLSLPDEDVVLQADGLRIAQAIANLLANAAKYTPRGGHIRLAAGPLDGMLAVTVADDGIGLAAGDSQRIFDLFVQADPGDGEGGLGIGLALARSIAELHGGTVDASSEGPGRGSTFTLRLPLVDAPALPAVPGPSLHGGQGRTLLLADDNGDAIWGLRKLLERGGYRVLTATTGAQSLELAARERLHGVLLDIGLPDMSGLEVARRLRAMAGGPSLLLIAVSGLGQDSDVRQSREAGFDAHMTKPPDLRQLQKLLDGGRAAD